MTNEPTLEDVHDMLIRMVGDGPGPRLTPRQYAISGGLTETLNEAKEGVTSLAVRIDEICNEYSTIEVTGASLQLMLNAIHAVAESTIVSNQEGETDVPLLELRNDVAIAVCDIIVATLATAQGLGEQDK